MKFFSTVWRIGSKVRSVEQILSDREIVHQTRGDLHDPFLLEGMRDAVERIRAAVEAREYIWIYGDYDVDGITSCAILMRYFESIGARAAYYIPDRVSNGYGLSVSGIEEIVSKGGNLLITVDCGINAFAEADFAKEKGLDLIITDHHMVEDRLPQAYAVINPKRGGYPFAHLAGCGVAFKLVQALAGERFAEIIDRIIDIAAIGTIADIVSLTGENRIIVSEGLKNIRNTGLRQLIRVAGKEVGSIGTGDVSFVIAPIINACGRIGNPKLGVELLLAEDAELAERMARRLYTLNQERQMQCKQATEESIRIVEQSVSLSANRVIAVCGDGWHSGIIGIVASKLVETYHKPAIVLTRADGQLKGSARSIRGVSIYDILGSVKQYLLRFGGHDLAAGLTLDEAVFDEFSGALRTAAEQYPSDCFIAEKNCDYLVTPDVITMKFIRDLQQIEPFGLDNPEPVFEMRDLSLISIARVGIDGRHAKITVKAGLGTFDGIAFGLADAFSGIRSGDRISILFSPEISNYRGTESISLRVRDVHSGSADFHPELRRAMDRAMADFVIRQPKFYFTRLPSFDKIIELNRVDVYTYEDMKKLQKWVYDNDIEHEILFGDEPPNAGADANAEARVNVETGAGVTDGGDAKGNADAEAANAGANAAENDGGKSVLLIRFLPTPAGGDAFSGMAFLDYVPQRRDVEQVFRLCKKFSTAPLDKLAGIIRINIPKILVSFELLKDVGILNYHVVNNYVHLDWKKVQVTKKLEEIELYRKIQRETSGGSYEESSDMQS